MDPVEMRPGAFAAVEPATAPVHANLGGATIAAVRWDGAMHGEIVTLKKGSGLCKRSHRLDEAGDLVRRVGEVGRKIDPAEAGVIGQLDRADDQLMV